MQERFEATYRRLDRGSAVHYRLPRRRLGKLALFGIFLIGFTCLFSGFAVFWMIGASKSITANGQFSIIGVLFTAFGLPFFFVGLVPGLIGLSAMFGRSEIALRDGKLRSIDRVGPLRWTRKRKMKTIRKLHVAAAPRGGSQAMAGLSALVTLGARGRPFVIAWGYPRAMMLEIANELAERLEVERPAGPIGEDDAPVEVSEITMTAEGSFVEDEPRDQPTPQPEGSRCALERRGDGLTITVPPAGLVKGSKGLFPFGIIWLLFTGGICGTLVVGFFRQGGIKQALLPIAFSFLFVGVGIILIICGINLGRRRAILDVVGDTLLISRQNIFGIKQDERTRDELKAIKVGPSGMEVNDVPVMCLHVVPRQGKTIKMLTQLEDEELKWIAAELRAALNLGY